MWPSKLILMGFGIVCKKLYIKRWTDIERKVLQHFTVQKIYLISFNLTEKNCCRRNHITAIVDWCNYFVLIFATFVVIIELLKLSFETAKSTQELELFISVKARDIKSIMHVAQDGGCEVQFHAYMNLFFFVYSILLL